MGDSLSERSRVLDADERVAEVLRQLPATFVSAPDRATEARHLAAMKAAAHDLAHEEITEREPATGDRRWLLPVPATKWRTALIRNRPMIITAKLAATALALCGLTAGFAVAGVTLPDPARGVADAVGLPNQEAEEHAGGVGDVEGASRDAEVRQDAEHRQDGEAGAKGNGDDVDARSHNGDHGIGEQVTERTEQLRSEMEAAGTDPEARKQAGQDFGNDVKEMATEQAPTTGAGPEAGRETGQTQSEQGQVKGQDVAGERIPEIPDRP